MKYLKRIILSFFIIPIIFGTTFAWVWDLRVEIPNWWWNAENKQFQDIIADGEFITWNKASNSFTKMVQLINTYLRIAILIVFMMMLIYAWFILITSRWDPEKFKKWNMTLLYIWIWIWIALLAYVIINIVVNFF